MMAEFARQLRRKTREHRWVGRAGIVGVVTAAAVVTLASAALAAGLFPDVEPNYAYHGAIRELARLGIISGYSDGRFGPEDPVTRQQFAKMIVGVAGYPVSEADKCRFADVAVSGPDSLYPDNYVEVCAAHGITVGTTPNTFNPGGHITRLQAVSMVVRAVDDLRPGLLEVPPADFQATPGWGDDATHGPNAARAEYGGLLNGLDLGMSSTGDMTRGEVAQILHNLVAKLTYGSNPLRTALFLGLNVQRPPLDDPLVRKALAVAVDREAVAQFTGITGAVPATGWLCPGIPGFDRIHQDALPATANVTEAAALLAQAGYPGGAGLPEIKISVTMAQAGLADLIKSQWEAMGVTATVAPVSWDQYSSVLASDDLQVYRMGWMADFNDPYELYSLFRTGSPWNYTRWSSSAFDQLLDAALQAPGDEDALAAYVALEEMLLQELPVIPLCWF